MSGKELFFARTKGTGNLSDYEKSSPIYSLLSGQRVGQIPLDEHNEIDRDEQLGFRKILAWLEWAFLALAFGCSRLPWVKVQQPGAFLAFLGLFAAFIGTAHHAPSWRKHHGKRWHTALNVWAMLLFASGAIWQTGALESPLLPLYFLPVALGGALIGMFAALLQTVLLTFFFFLLAGTDVHVVTQGADAGDYLSGPAAQLILLWMTAYVTALVAEQIDGTKDKIRQLSRTDQLTGLWNMKMLLIFMEREYQRTLTRTGKFAVLMIDADSLKAVNDLHGHHAGTMLIVSLSETMRNELREEDMLARFGGDEFIAFLPDTSCEQAYRIAERMRRKIAEAPLNYEGNVVAITVSCGIACFPDHGEDLKEIMKMADKALYISKDKGKNQCTVYRPGEERPKKKDRKQGK